MPADRLVMSVRDRHLFEHLRIPASHAGVIHHLAQADDALPLHGLCHFLRPDGHAGCLQSRRRRHTGRHLHPDVNGLLLRFIHHQLHALETEHIGDLMRVDEHAGRAAHGDRAHKLGDRHHAGFDVHVTIQQTRDEVASLRIDDLCVLADRMTRIFTHIGNMPVDHGNIRAGDDLSGLDAYPFAVEDDQVGRNASHGDIDECAGKFFGRWHSVSVERKLQSSISL